MIPIFCTAVTGKTISITPKPCPFCGSTDLRVVAWSDDSGDYDAIECEQCLGCAPAQTWNNRATEEDPGT